MSIWPILNVEQGRNQNEHYIFLSGSFTIYVWETIVIIPTTRIQKHFIDDKYFLPIYIRHLVDISYSTHQYGVRYARNCITSKIYFSRGGFETIFLYFISWDFRIGALANQNFPQNIYMIISSKIGLAALKL